MDTRKCCTIANALVRTTKCVERLVLAYHNKIESAPEGNMPTSWLSEINEIMLSIEDNLKATEFLKVYDFMSVYEDNEGEVTVVADAAGLKDQPKSSTRTTTT